MKPEKVNIILPENYDGKPVELVFREGEAEPIKDYQAVFTQNVVMPSLFAYVLGRGFPEGEQLPGIVIFNLEDRSVQLNINPNDIRADRLTSRLELHPDLVAFGINEEKQFTAKQLVKHITRYAHCLGDVTAPKKLIKSLQNHDVKFEQQMKNMDDRQGNTEKSVKTALKFVEGELDPNWKLLIPIFKGEAPVELEVEIQIDIQNGNPVYSFWCLELEIISKQMSDSIISDVVNKLGKYFTCLRTS